MEVEIQMAIIVAPVVEAAIEDDEVVLLPSCKDQVLWVISFRYSRAQHWCTLLYRTSYHINKI